MTIAPSQIDNKVVWLVSDNPDNTVVDGVLTEIANFAPLNQWSYA